MRIYNGVLKQNFPTAVKNEAKKIVSKLPSYKGKKKVIYTLPKAVQNKGWAIVDYMNCLLFKYEAYLKKDAFDPSYPGEITIYPERIEELKKRNKEISDELDRIITEIGPKGKTEYELAKDIANKTCEIFEYCKEKDKKGYLVHCNTHSYDIVMGKCGVCSGYAKLFSMLCDKVGLEAQYLDNDDHAWNRVKVNGKWLYIDCTWDDLGDYNAYFFSLNPDNIFHNIKKHPRHKRVGWDCWDFK